MKTMTSQDKINTDDLMNDVGYKPDTSVEDGIEKFVKWYKGYYNI